MTPRGFAGASILVAVLILVYGWWHSDETTRVTRSKGDRCEATSTLDDINDRPEGWLAAAGMAVLIAMAVALRLWDCLRGGFWRICEACARCAPP